MSTTLRGFTAATAALSATALIVLTLAGPAAAAPTPPPSVPGATCDWDVCQYAFPLEVADPQTFVVPDGVGEIAVEIAGSAGHATTSQQAGAGGSLRTTLDVTAGETLTVKTPQVLINQRPRLELPEGTPRWQTRHLGGDLAAVYRGQGRAATPLVVVGGGGAASHAAPGGDGGGWHKQSALLLHGLPGGGEGGGGGASPSGPGAVAETGIEPRGVAGTGPVGAPGTRGLGGWALDKVMGQGAAVTGADGGHGWYGGAPGGYVTEGGASGGAGGGSGYLAPGLTAQRASYATREAATGSGLVLFEWARPVILSPVLQYADGAPVEGELTSREVVVVASDLPPGSRVSVTSGPAKAYTVWGAVQPDGTVRVPFTIAYQEHRDGLRIAVEVHRGGERVAAAHLDPAVPALETATVLTAPDTVHPGEKLTVQLERTGTQFGEATRGLEPRAVLDRLWNRSARVLLDDEVLRRRDLGLPNPFTVPWRGPLTLQVTAPTTPGEHTLTFQVDENDQGLHDVTHTFTVVDPAAPTATPTPTATATPAPTATPTERAEVLAADDGTDGGVLASTGAQVTALGLGAATLIGAGLLLHRARSRAVRPARSRRAA